MLVDFLDLVFPSICVGCQQPLVRGEKQLCTFCRSNLPVTYDHIMQDNRLQYKFYGMHQVKGVWSYLYFRKEGMVQKIIHQVKYRGNQNLGKMLGQWYGIIRKVNLPEIDVVIPVPLHAKRLKERGYNQAACFAEGFAKQLSLHFSPNAMLRTRYTLTQTGKSRYERFENVEEAFEVNVDLQSKRVVLIDDVITTGATLEICAQALVEAGASSVYIIAFASAV